MKDRPLSEEESNSPELSESTQHEALRAGLIFPFPLGKVVGGFLFALGVLLLVAVFYDARFEGRAPNMLPIVPAISWLLVPGICLWIRAGRPAFGFWRGVWTLVGASNVSGGVVSLLALVVLDMTGLAEFGEGTLPKGLVLSIAILSLVLGIPMLIFGFRPKKGLKRN
jgi:hypothetical protein